MATKEFKLYHAIKTETLVYRLIFPAYPYAINWLELSRKVADKFRMEAHEIGLVYLDGDNNRILVSSQEDLNTNFEQLCDAGLIEVIDLIVLDNWIQSRREGALRTDASDIYAVVGTTAQDRFRAANAATLQGQEEEEERDDVNQMPDY